MWVSISREVRLTCIQAMKQRRISGSKGVFVGTGAACSPAPDTVGCWHGPASTNLTPGCSAGRASCTMQAPSTDLPVTHPAGTQHPAHTCQSHTRCSAPHCCHVPSSSRFYAWLPAGETEARGGCSIPGLRSSVPGASPGPPAIHSSAPPQNSVTRLSQRLFMWQSTLPRFQSELKAALLPTYITPSLVFSAASVTPCLVFSAAATTPSLAMENPFLKTSILLAALGTSWVQQAAPREGSCNQQACLARSCLPCQDLCLLRFLCWRRMV